MSPTPGPAGAGGVDIPGILLGALLALAAQAFIQLVVVPYVDARRRRQDRWERDLLALAELLTAELPAKMAALKRASWAMRSIHDDLSQREDIPPEVRAEYVQGLAGDAREALTTYEALAESRMRWLVGRALAWEPDAPDLRKLDQLATVFRVHGMNVSLWAYLVDDSFDSGKFDSQWAQHEAALTKLAAHAVSLADRRSPPRKVSLRRLGHWIKRKVHRRGGSS